VVEELRPGAEHDIAAEAPTRLRGDMVPVVTGMDERDPLL